MEDATLNNQHRLPISSDNLIKLLEDRKIKFDLITHKPLYTVNESKAFYESQHEDNELNCHIKNLYLRDKKKNNYLFVCEQDKIIDLKDLSHLTSSTRFSFGSSQRLFENLGVFPGAVSPFCMLNGKKNGVKLFFDTNFKNIKNIYLHPFVNDRTIKMKFNDLVKFLYEYDIDINWINI